MGIPVKGIHTLRYRVSKKLLREPLKVRKYKQEAKAKALQDLAVDSKPSLSRCNAFRVDGSRELKDKKVQKDIKIVDSSRSMVPKNGRKLLKKRSTK